MRVHPLRRSAVHVSVLGTCGGLLGLPVHAQVPPDAGAVLRDQQRPAPELPRPVPTLRVDEPARSPLDASSVTRFVLKSVRFSGHTVYGAAELQAVVQDALGKEVDFATLDNLAARVSRHYRDHGYLVARAYLPAQDIHDGAIEIAVIEGRLARVLVNNGSRVIDRVVDDHTRGLPGSVVQEQTLERAILLINDLAGVGEARAGLSPGAKVGESDLTLNLANAPSWRGSVEADNYGNRYTGTARITGRLALQSPLGWGDGLSGVVTRGFDGLNYGRVAYQVPIGGQGLVVGAAVGHVGYALGKDFAALDRHGTANSGTANLSYPFLRGSELNLYGRLALERNALKDLEGATGTGSEKSTRGTTLSLDGDVRDGWMGGNVSVFSLGYNAGRLTIDTPTTRAIDDAAARTGGHYGKWNLSLLRLQTLAGPMTVYLALSAQKADKNLDSSEKFSLGGAQGVRAYPQGEASGDSGCVANVELRYTTTAGALPGIVQPLAFVDAGFIRINQRPFDSASNRRRLAGLGVGVTWTLPNDFQVRLSVATRLGREPEASTGSDQRTRGWMQVIKFL